MTSGTRSFRFAGLLAVCGLALAATGCPKKNGQARAPVFAAPAPTPETERPMNTAPDTSAAPPVEAVNPPALSPAETVPPSVSIPSKKPPAPRRPAAGQPAMDVSSEPPAHAPAPQISPEISAHDQATYERNTGDNIAVAEKNLQDASGKNWNAAQQDLVDKIRSFLAESRQASKDGDWARAQTLAQKARLLSVELINSF
jgi:hypothetical protein